MIDLESRDFFLAAVFCFITPLFAALSIALYASESNAFAPSLSFFKTKVFIFFTVSFMTLFLLSLKTLFRSDALFAFFAPFVIGIIDFIKYVNSIYNLSHNPLVHEYYQIMRKKANSDMISFMISHIEGKIIRSEDKFVIVDVKGVGYKIYTPTSIQSPKTKSDDNVSLWTHLIVREDVLDLYGFIEYSEVELFKMLISVSGVGPKSALGVMGVAPLDTLKTAIASGDTSYLTKVSGIGKKNAQKIVLELRDKLGAINTDTTTSGAMREESDTVDALHSMGYSITEAREALQQIPQETDGTSEKIKEALRILGGGK